MVKRICVGIGIISLITITMVGCKNTGSEPDEPSDRIGITSIEPESGTHGMLITIFGRGFSSKASENIVTFSGVEAVVKEATDNELQVTVPEGSTTGRIKVEVNGNLVQGPVFKVLTNSTLQVIITTEGADQDRDGYIVNVNREIVLNSAINDTLLFQDLEEGSHQLELEELGNECSVQGANPRTISVAVQDTTRATIEVHCEEVVLRNKIVYRHCDGICDGLYIIDSDGTNPKQLTSHSWDSDPVISPDGTKVAFVNGRRNSELSEHHDEIYIVDASGYPTTRIPRPAESLHDGEPSWSPDGKKLLFVQSNSSSSGTDIVSINVDGTNRTKITDDRSDDLSPLYTPDGSKIIFYSLNRGGTAQIFIMNVDGTNITQLSNFDFFVHHLALSNNGSMVAFGVQGDPQQIYVMNTDGTGTRALTNNMNGYAFASWSPDDSQLIFYNFDTSDIFKINVDGSGLINLTNTPEIGESDPYWSPVE